MDGSSSVAVGPPVEGFAVPAGGTMAIDEWSQRVRSRVAIATESDFLRQVRILYRNCLGWNSLFRRSASGWSHVLQRMANQTRHMGSPDIGMRIATLTHDVISES
jgi:hypothetical protein